MIDYKKILACFISFVIVGAKLVYEQPKKVSAEEQIAALTSQQNELDKQNEVLNTRLANLKNDIRHQKAYRTSVNEKINVLKKQINIETQKLKIINQEINEKQTQVEAIQHEIDESIDDLCVVLRAIYKNGEAPTLNVLLNVDDIDDFFEKADLIQKFSNQNAELIDNLKKNGIKLQQDKEIIEKNQQDAEKSTCSLEIRRKELRNLQKDCEKFLTGLQREESKLQSQIAANRARKNQVANDSKSHAPHKTSRYMHPLNGVGRVSSEFGRRGRGFHNGIDFAAQTGTPIIAVADGVVSTVNSSNIWGSGWGLHVKINHGDGYETISAHMSRTNVAPGQHVKAGDVIGFVGNTGRSTGSHLHFGTSKNGHWYNPRAEL